MADGRAETHANLVGDLKKCKDAGFYTCQSLLMYPKKVISLPFKPHLCVLAPDSTNVSTQWLCTVIEFYLFLYVVPDTGPSSETEPAVLHMKARALVVPFDAQRKSCLLTIELPLAQVLCEIKGLSEAKVEKCVDAAKKMVPQFGWQSASMFATKVNQTLTRLITGSADSYQVNDLNMQEQSHCAVSTLYPLCWLNCRWRRK